MMVRILIIASFSIFLTSQAQNSNSIKLETGESIIDTVHANKRCQKTMIILEKGGKYQITAEGEWQDAGFKPTDANGFGALTSAMKKGSFLKPMNRENYMKLLVSIRHKKTAIGIAGVINVYKRSRLSFMPNDATFFFGNNSGFLVVTIERL